MFMPGVTPIGSGYEPPKPEPATGNDLPVDEPRTGLDGKPPAKPSPDDKEA